MHVLSTGHSSSIHVVVFLHTLAGHYPKQCRLVQNAAYYIRVYDLDVPGIA